MQRTPVNLRKYDAVALLVEKGIDVNHRDKFGRTPLYMACRSGVLVDIEKLLVAGADPNVQESKYGHAPIHVAAIKLGGKYLDGWTKGIDGTKAIENFKSIFKLLMENGAKLGLKDHHGEQRARHQADYQQAVLGWGARRLALRPRRRREQSAQWHAA